MKNKKISKVVATGIMVAGLVASSGGLSLAADNSVISTAAPTNVQWFTGKPAAAGKVMISTKAGMALNKDVLKEALSDLVTAGTITQTQSDEVFTYFQNNTPEKPVIKLTPPAEGTSDLNGPVQVEKPKMLMIKDPLKDLVDKGTISETQAQAIRDKMGDIADRQMQQQWQTGLDTLVDKGTITRDQADKIFDFLVDNNKNMQSMFEQAKDLSQEQSAQNIKENLDNIKDPVSRMVEQGIISQEQADALRQEMPFLPMVVHVQKLSPEQLQANLDALADKGTITLDQVTGIKDFLSANEQKMKGILDQVKSADPQDKMQDLKQNLAGLKDPVSQMVEQGIISQEQADAVREATMGFSGMVVKGEPPAGGVSGGQSFFYSTSDFVADDSQN